ncbi:FliM/FliN family flagellar motor switch protein [Litoreibacter sp.]|nr:FliM/FliN family flagellar motor switch protein [Litoreibacter sp.]
MSNTGDILRKKMRPRRSAVGPCFAWWSAEVDRVMRKVCKSALQMDVKIGELKGRQATAPQALDEMPNVALPFLLGAANNTAALFVLDGLLIDGLIEQKLLGEVLPTQRLDRPVTSIDAGLSDGFVRATLTGIVAEASGQFTGLHVDRVEQDRAALRLSLGEGLYDILEAEIDMGPGVKTGRFEIWLPAVSTSKSRSAKSRANPLMSDLLQSCEVDLEAWLVGCESTAQGLMNLEVGSVLVVARSALTSVEIKDCDGRPFAQARLGQLNGARAVRLTKVHGKNALQAAPKVLSPNQPVALPLSDPQENLTPTEANFEEALDGTSTSVSDVKGKALTG